MYSYEDRIRAIELYIKLGKRVGATIRQLGYPTENSLKSWHEHYVRGLDVPRVYVRAKPKYSQAQKQLAVQHYLDQGRCIAWTIKALGYPSRDLLRAWIRESHPELHRRLVGRSDSHARSPAMKQAAVIALCTRQESAQAVADQMGVCRPTLYNWKNQLLGQEIPAPMKPRQESVPLTQREELERQLEVLRRDIHRLQLEHDLLKKANELLKKDPGIDLRSLSNRDKTLLVDALKQTYALPELLKELGLARSSPMATSNSPTFGQSNSPMAGRSDYDDSGVTAMRAAASFRR